MAEKCARLVRDMYEDSGDVCRRSDRWIRGGTTSGICSDPLLVCSGDRLTDGGQAGVSVELASRSESGEQVGKSLER